MTILSVREQAVRERVEIARADPDFAPDLRIAEGTGARWYAEDVPWLLNLVDELTAALRALREKGMAIRLLDEADIAQIDALLAGRADTEDVGR